MNAAYPTVDMASVLASIIPDIPSNIRSLLPTQIQSLMGEETTGRPSQTAQPNAAGKTSGEGGWNGLSVFLGVGVVISVVVGGLAALS